MQAQNKTAAPTFVYLDPINKRFPVSVWPGQDPEIVIAQRLLHCAVHLAAMKRALGEL
jgi:hypothetical protein